MTSKNRFVIKSSQRLIFNKNKKGLSIKKLMFYKNTVFTNKLKIITCYESNKPKLEAIQCNSIK